MVDRGLAGPALALALAAAAAGAASAADGDTSIVVGANPWSQSNAAVGPVTSTSGSSAVVNQGDTNVPVTVNNPTEQKVALTTGETRVVQGVTFKSTSAPNAPNVGGSYVAVNCGESLAGVTFGNLAAAFGITFGSRINFKCLEAELEGKTILTVIFEGLKSDDERLKRIAISTAVETSPRIRAAVTALNDPNSPVNQFMNTGIIPTVQVGNVIITDGVCPLERKRTKPSGSGGRSNRCTGAAPQRH